ncbi:MAG: phosphotransferase [Candidatus Acidiferrales bacterium]
MASPRETDSITCRIIAPRRNATEILLGIDGTRFSLPRLAIPRHRRIAQSLQAAACREWRQEVICLFSPRDSSAWQHSAEDCAQVLECRRPEDPPPHGTDWVHLNSLTREAFHDPMEFLLTQDSLAECQNYRDGVLPGPFGKLGWFEDLTEWMQSEIKRAGLRLADSFYQLNAGPSFSLIRFATNGPAVWFKAVGAPNTREFPLTIALAGLFPDFLPEILATLPASNGWLSREAEGEQLCPSRELALWQSAARELANLQIASIGKASSILRAGGRDLRASALFQMADPFLLTMETLMQAQEKAYPPPLSRHELSVLNEQLKKAITLVRTCQIPDTLEHLDFNPGNIFVSPDRAMFIDWAEACVGNPLLTFQYLLEHFRKNVGKSPGQEAQLTAAYSGAWDALVSPSEFSEVLSLTPLLAVFAYAAANDSWRKLQAPYRTRAAGYLRSVTRIMKREANQRFGRRAECQSYQN